MKEISNHFALIRHEDIKANFEKDLKPYIPEQSLDCSCLSAVSFDQTLKDEHARLWEQTFRAVTTNPRVEEYDGRRCAIGIIFTDGSCVLMGSIDQVPMITVKPVASSFEVLATFTTSKKASW